MSCVSDKMKALLNHLGDIYKLCYMYTYYLLLLRLKEK